MSPTKESSILFGQKCFYETEKTYHALSTQIKTCMITAFLVFITGFIRIEINLKYCEYKH